jgi:hypothetical protein
VMGELSRRMEVMDCNELLATAIARAQSVAAVLGQDATARTHHVAAFSRLPSAPNVPLMLLPLPVTMAPLP